MLWGENAVRWSSAVEGGVTPILHRVRLASHNNNSDGYERIPRFHVEQYAYLASKLDSMKEGNGGATIKSCVVDRDRSRGLDLNQRPLGYEND